MKVKELRELIEPDTTLWIETEAEQYLEANEKDYLSHKYDNYDISIIKVQHYKSIGTTGITIQVQKP